jgi:hypothetical protein
MSRRIVCLALVAAAALAAIPASAAHKSRAGASRHISHHVAHQRHGSQHRHFARRHHGLHRHAPAFGSIGPVSVIDPPIGHHAGVNVVIANAWLVADPAWKLCQLDPSLAGRPDLCVPYSYYPFGPYGYRPFGTYWPHTERTGPIYAVAPRARVIRIKRDD